MTDPTSPAGRPSDRPRPAAGEASAVAPRPGGPNRSGRAARRWWIAAGTFVIGLIVGGLVVGFAGWGSSSAPIVVSTSPASSAVAATPSGSLAPGATGTVTVNAACLQALDDAQRAYGQIGDLVSALRNLSAGAIDQVIRQLQPLQSQLRQELRACHVITELPNGSLTTATPGVSSPIPIPSASPSAAPTTPVASTPVPSTLIPSPSATS